MTSAVIPRSSQNMFLRKLANFVLLSLSGIQLLVHQCPWQQLLSVHNSTIYTAIGFKFWKLTSITVETKLAVVNPF